MGLSFQEPDQFLCSSELQEHDLFRLWQKRGGLPFEPTSGRTRDTLTSRAAKERWVLSACQRLPQPQQGGAGMTHSSNEQAEARQPQKCGRQLCSRVVTSRHSGAGRGGMEDDQPGLRAAGLRCKGRDEERGRQEAPRPSVEGPHAPLQPTQQRRTQTCWGSFLPLTLLRDQQTNHPHFPSSRLLKFRKSGNWFVTPRGRREEKVSQRTHCPAINCSS